jgi:hypothetical protein
MIASIAPIDITNVMPFILSLLGGGVLVVLLAQGIKRVFGMNSEHAIHIMVALVSGAAALAQYILNFRGLPVEVLGVSSTSIYGISQFVYKESKYVSDLLSRVQAANKSNSSAAPAVATPAVSAPGEATTGQPAPASTAETPTPPTSGFNA